VSTTATDAVEPHTRHLPAQTTAPAAEVANYDPVAKGITIPTPVAGYSLTFTQGQRTLTDEQMHLLSPLGIEATWDPNRVLVFLLDCGSRGLDPWAREAYLMLYPGNKYISHVGIDGFRRKAEETGAYRGRIGPQWCGPDGQWSDIWADKTTAPTAARVGILRAGFDGPVWGVAMYDEYAVISDVTVWDDRAKRKVKTGQRAASGNWRTAADGGKPAVMTAKCAEATALRAAFPRSFRGLYVPEEFDRIRAETPAEDPGAAARKAAYDAAQSAAAAPVSPAGPGTIDSTATETTAADPVPAAEDAAPANAGELLLAELTAQATILGRPVDALVARWQANHDGRDFVADATVDEMVHHLGRIRQAVIAQLRNTGRHDVAAQYARAPKVATVDVLFGSDPAGWAQ
jgi:phage recombination protein Bet